MINKLADILINKKKFVFLCTLFVLAVLLIGLSSDLKYSDEIFHFWFAKDWHMNGERPVYNELVDTVVEYDYYRYYVNAPLWHYNLKSIFKLTGASKNTAQTYMAMWYLLLIFGTYLLARTIYDERSGLYSAFIVATMPFIVSFSILFFIDVPIAAATPFLIYFLIKRRYLISGIIMGSMFLLKENAYFLFPAACALFLINADKSMPVKLPRRLLHAVLFSLLVIVITLPNFKYRLDNFHGIFVPNDRGAILSTAAKLFDRSYLSIGDMSNSKTIDEDRNSEATDKYADIENYVVSPLTSPLNFFKYLGILFPLMFLWRIICIFKYRDLALYDIFLMLPVLIYIPFYYLAFKGWWEIRYLSPLLPLLCIFSVKGVKHLSPAVHAAVLSAGIIMLFSATAFTYTERQVTPPETEMLNRIKQLPDERILTPEELFISYYTGKPTIWNNSFISSYSHGLCELLWDDSLREKILRDHNIRYILIPHKRTYDDTKARHISGYPESFIEKIKNSPFIEKIYDNEYASLWRVSL